MDERRPDPEELLKQIKQEEIAKQRGKIKNNFLATQRVLERLMPCWKQLMLLIMPVSM